MNIDPSLWGPSSWKFLHYITVGYPEKPSDEIKKNTYNFFMALKYLLPCERCRYDYANHLNKYPLLDDILSSRTKLINWLINIHNEVNMSTNKPIIGYDKAVELYTSSIEHEPFLEKIKKKLDSRTLTIIIALFLIIIFIVIILYNRS